MAISKRRPNPNPFMDEDAEVLLEDIPYDAETPFIVPEEFTRIVIGVDPAITSGPNADETGIIVAAKGPHQPSTCRTKGCTQHAYVLQDATLPKGDRNDPDAWAKRVVQMFDKWDADLIVVEDNAMKELGEVLFRTVRVGLPIERPNANESKRARAEPIVALYEQGRVHHVGDPAQFAILEEQMTTWVPPEPGKRAIVSPDRMDALVWAITELKIQGGRRRPLPPAAAFGIEKTNEWAIESDSGIDYGQSFGSVL